MPWMEKSAMDERREFVSLALLEGSNRRALCRRFTVSPTTGYKWTHRAQEGLGLEDRSRRPHHSPNQTSAAVETAILAMRDAYPAWGARKIKHCLERDGVAVPALSTVHKILSRNDRIVPSVGSAAAHERFERPAPNQLWQMDFKGRVPLSDGSWCHPLTVLDDHSRYAVCLKACDNEQTGTVREALEETFRHHGLPDAFFVDNGSPWGGGVPGLWTPLGVWLLKLGVQVIHSRPYHPQSRGKNERFNRTLKAEVFAFRRFDSLSRVQQAFDEWRPLYNSVRPHQALDMQVPASRYKPSPRTMPHHLPSPDYPTGDIVRKVTDKAVINFRNRAWYVPKAFRGERVALRPIEQDGKYGVFFGARKITTIDLNAPQRHRETVHHVPEHASTISPD
jgi:transposase InsO family protein